MDTNKFLEDQNTGMIISKQFLFFNIQISSNTTSAQKLLLNELTRELESSRRSYFSTDVATHIMPPHLSKINRSRWIESVKS